MIADEIKAEGWSVGLARAYVGRVCFGYGAAIQSP